MKVKSVAIRLTPTIKVKSKPFVFPTWEDCQDWFIEVCNIRGSFNDERHPIFKGVFREIQNERPYWFFHLAEAAPNPHINRYMVKKRFEYQIKGWESELRTVFQSHHVKPHQTPAEAIVPSEPKTWRDIPFSGDLKDWLEKDTFEHFDETLAEWQKTVRFTNEL
jgi:hypothetical protein